MVLRKVPSDNSCLFNAISLAFCGSYEMSAELRVLVASRIRKARFDKTVLQKEPEDYARWIERPSSWGGEPEMVILGEELDLQIATMSVQHAQLTCFGPSHS